MPVLLRVPWGGAKRTIDPSKLSPTLAENSWKMIARASEEGIASTLWKVGDEIDIVLSGDYKGSITMQIAGFDHDALASGGKAGITFLSKQVLAPERMHETKIYCYDWTDSTLYSDVVPKIRASLPDGLRGSIKTILKACSNSNNSGYDHVTEDDVFIPGLAEIMLKDDVRIDSTIRGRNVPDDGVRYEIFEVQEGVGKENITGAAGTWWTRSSYSNYFMYVTTDGYVRYSTASYSYGICFGFCI